jgi:hypothetical protein
MQAIISKPEFPPHIIVFDGRLVNTSTPENQIRELQIYAKLENFDIEAECQSRYGYGSDWLTLAQRSEIGKLIIDRKNARFLANPSHWHRCSDCGQSERFFDKGCAGKHPQGDIKEECYVCRNRLKSFYRRGSNL